MKEKSSVYIAGPMTGYKMFNFQAFFDAEYILKNIFSRVYNPALADTQDGLDVTGTTGKLSEIPEFDLKKAMKRNCDELLDCDIIYMLSGWEKSKGAKLEHDLAVYVGMKVIYQEAL